MNFSRSLLVLWFLLAAPAWSPAEGINGFFGGMTGGLTLRGFSHHEFSEDGMLFHLAGGGGARLGNSPWVLGGSGASTSLKNSRHGTEMHMDYGGIFALYLMPAGPFQWGPGVFFGGGSYALYLEDAGLFKREKGSFMLVEPQVNLFYPVNRILMADLALRYAMTNNRAFVLGGPVVSLGLRFGHL